MKRYHHKSAEVWYQKVGNKEYVVVYHEIADDVKDPLAGWATSTHPFDIWFREQLSNLHDMDEGTPAQCMFHFKL